MQYIQHIRYIQYVQYMEHIQYIQHIRYIKYVQYIEHIEYIQYIQHIRYMQYVQYIEYIQYIQHIQYVQYILYSMYSAYSMFLWMLWDVFNFHNDMWCHVACDVIWMNCFIFTVCMGNSHTWSCDSFRIYVPMLAKWLCVLLRKKAVAFETSCVYSVVLCFKTMGSSCHLLLMWCNLLLCH